MENDINQIKNNGYRRFIAGQITSLLGSEIVSFVLGVYLAREYGNTLYVAITMVLSFLPRVIISPIAGVWADKGDRKKIVITSDLIQAIITSVLVLLFNLKDLFSWSFWNATIFGEITSEIFILFGFIFLRSIFQAVQGPSVSSIIPTIVPKEKLSRLNGLFQFSQGAAGLIAPLVAGFLINYMEMYNLLWIDAVTFLIALGLIFTVKIPKRVKEERETPDAEKISKFKKFGQDLSVGAKVAKQIPGLAALLATFVITNIFVSPVNTLSDILVFSTHGGTTNEYVIMSVSFAAGMIFGSIISTLVKEWKHISATLLIGIIGLYAGLFIVGVTPTPDILPGSVLGLRTSFWILAIGGFITTLGIPIFSTIAVTMIQLSVPIEKMGRFSGFMNALMSIFTPIAYLVSGYLGTIIYIPYVIMGSSIIAIILMVCMWIFSDIKKMEPLIKEKLAMVKQQAMTQAQKQEETQTELTNDNQAEIE